MFVGVSILILGFTVMFVAGVSSWRFFSLTRRQLLLEFHHGLLNVVVADQPLFQGSGLEMKPLADSGLWWFMSAAGSTALEHGGWDGWVVSSFGGPHTSGAHVRFVNVALMPISLILIALGLVPAIAELNARKADRFECDKPS